MVKLCQFVVITGILLCSTWNAFASYQTKNGRTTYTVDFPESYKDYLTEENTERLIKEAVESGVQENIYSSKVRVAESEAKTLSDSLGK